MPLHTKLSFFAYIISGERSTNIRLIKLSETKVLAEQVSLPEISLILQKMKISQKRIYALFAQRPSIVILLVSSTGMSSMADSVATTKNTFWHNKLSHMM